MRIIILPLLLTACGEPEGAYPAECTDNIDNDDDGQVDCDDEDCADSEECASGGGTTWGTGPGDSGDPGGGGTNWGMMDNEEACETFLELLNSCGGYDFSEAIDCSAYRDYDCDLVPYFECLVEVTTCDEKTGMPEMGDWPQCEHHAKGCEEPD